MTFNETMRLRGAIQRRAERGRALASLAASMRGVASELERVAGASQETARQVRRFVDGMRGAQA